MLSRNKEVGRAISREPFLMKSSAVSLYSTLKDYFSVGMASYFMNPRLAIATEFCLIELLILNENGEAFSETSRVVVCSLD